jgi:hypothetical protein
VELDVADAGFLTCPPSFVEHAGGGIDGDHSPRSDETRKIARDRPWPAPDVEQVEPRTQTRQQVGGRVLGGA